MPYVPLSISIKDPCSEAWDGMTPVTDISRHCASCDKVITDFSRMTDAQIGRTLATNGNRLCGRFRRDQLDRPLMLNGPRRRRGLGPVAAAATLLLAAPAFAQTAEPAPTEQIATTEKKSFGNSQPILDFHGVVTDEAGEPLIGVSILIKNRCFGTVTDFDGKFSLRIPEGQDLELIVSYTGFATEEVSYSAAEVAEFAANEGANLAGTKLKESCNIMLGVMVAGGFDVNYTPVDHLMVHKVTPIYYNSAYTGYSRGDWKDYWRDLFAKRKARRAERKLERQARKDAKRLLREEAFEPTVVITKTEVKPVLSESFGLKVSPNPFQGELRVEFTLPAPQKIELTLLDVSGRTLRSWMQPGRSGLQAVVLTDLPKGLPAGAYFLRLATKDGVETIQLVR